MTRCIPFAAVVVAVGQLAAAPQVWAGGVANLIEVTTLADGINHADGLCSLREAIQNARLNTQGGILAGECAGGSAGLTDVIVLSSGSTYSLTVAGSGDDQGDLDLRQDQPISLDLRIEVDGATPATIQQTIVGERVVENHGLTVEFDQLVLRGGNITEWGGGLRNTDGDVRISRSSLINNRSGGGGAIHSTGTLEIVDSELSLNTSSGLGGGALFNGDGGVVRISGTTFSENDSGFAGGAIVHEGALLELLGGSTLELNSAGLGVGGAVAVLAAANLVVEDVLFDSNSTMLNGGAIATSSTGTFVVRNSTFINHFAAQGGAIFASSLTPLNISGSRFSGNSASSQGGAIRVEQLLLSDSRVEDNTLFAGGSSGGGLHIAQSGTILNSVIRGNSAGSGGGVHAAVLLIEDSLLELNSASLHGGAAHVLDHADLLRVRSRANLASGSGAGIYLAAGGSMPSRIRQSLFDENTADGQGGGLWLGGEASIGNTTITLNGANGGGGGLYIAASADLGATNISLVENPNGRDLHKFGNLSLQNSVVSSAGAPNCLTDAGNPLIVSLGNNISDDLSCPGLSHPSDQAGIDPMLQALADNGGNTLTYAPAPGSPAIDAGNDAACAAQPVGGLDQRGAVRPSGAACDIGAHELGAELPTALFSDGFEAG